MEKDIFNLDEYQLYSSNNSTSNDDLFYQDSKKMYFNEISKYPLLTAEEEIKYLKMLANPMDKKLLSIKENKSYIITDLNLGILFYSLCNSSSYQVIIDSLIKFYARLNSNNDKTIIILQKYLKEANKVNRSLNEDEINNLFHLDKVDNILSEKELFYEIKNFMNYKFAFDKMFVSNLKLVTNIAFKCRGNLSYMDLVNEGNLGLMRAIQTYDINFGNKFSTYATYWIYTKIRRAIISNHSIVKLPFYFVEDLYRFKKNVTKLELEEGRTFSYEELSRKLNIPFETIKQYYDFILSDAYLDDDTKTDDLTLKDTIPCNVDYDEEVFDYSISEDKIEQLLFILREKEAQIVKMYFGLCEYKNRKKSISEIAKGLNVTRQCINQIKVSAMNKLKKYYCENGNGNFLKDYIRH